MLVVGCHWPGYRYYQESRLQISSRLLPDDPIQWHGFVYDANGNLEDDDKDYVYEYDAWNRLISISTTGGSPTLVAEYRYNGLGQRIAEGDGTDTEYLIYDDRWRLISRHDGTDYLEETFYHQAGLDGYGGSSDVDSVLMRRGVRVHCFGMRLKRSRSYVRELGSKDRW